MSDASSAVTYTSVYTDSEPWRYYGEDSAETGPPRVIVYGYDGLPIQPVAPPSPDYVPGPEHPPSPDYVPDPEHPPSPIKIPYVPEPKYPEYLAPSNDETPLEDQPLPADASPIAASPDYVADSDLEEDPKEDPEDDHADYPADGGDGDDEPSDDDDDDDTDDEDLEEEPFKEDDEEEEEHPAPADSLAVPIVDLVLSARETEALEADEPTHAPGSPISAPLGYRAAGIRMRALLPSTSRRTDIPEADMPPRKRACLTAPTPKFKIRESSATGAARQPGPTKSDLRRCRVEQTGYGITDTWDEKQRTDEFEVRFEDAQFDRALLRARVNTLFTDRPDHRRTSMLMDREEMYSREAWTFSMDMSSAIAAHVRTLETQVAALITQITSLQTQLTTALGRIEALIDRDVAAALAERDADRSRNGNNSNDSGTGERRQMTTPRECSYTDFLKCQPMSFQGTEGVISLTRWLEKMEYVFQISNYTIACQDVAYAMAWATLKKMITDKYCPRGEIQKLKSKFWNLKVKGIDLLNYNHRFQELALMYDRMFPEESTKVERYIGGLPDMIYGSVKASKPQSMQEVIEFATEMMDKKMLTHAERQAEHKRKFDDTSRNTQHQQQSFKRNNMARAYTAGPGDKKHYRGTKPLCPKCNYHHDGPCAPKCTNCKKIGHLAHKCKGRPAAANNNQNNNNNQRAQWENARGITCYECGVLGHYKSDCPKLKNGNQGNRAGNGNVVAIAYAVGTAGTNPNSNVVTSTFLLNNRYASVLFDTGADRSFVSTAFSSLIDIIPTTLDHGYDVELADMIVCDEKLVRVPFGDEILIFHGNGSNNGHESRLNIISCTKTQRYLLKGCPIFLAHVTTKEAEDKSKEKRLEDVPIVQDFLEVFPEDLPGIPPTRQVEFQIDIVWCRTCGTGALSNKQEHEEHLKLILELLKKEQLYAKLSKCEFWILKVQFPGHVIDSQGIHVDPAKIESIKDWASSKTATEIRQFLGLAGYYKRFIEGFSKIASASILALPEGSDDFVVYCDASIKDLGAVLMQREKRHYMYGTKYTMFVDHKSSQNILDQKEMNMRHHRWLELLSDYDCKIRYHPRKANVVADALSQKERIKLLRVRALVMTIGLNLPRKILEAKTEAMKPENLKSEDVGGMLIENSKDPEKKPGRRSWNRVRTKHCA
nr:reverse transcriptase domain-containing protein [Tanacetum cinerariifolium]